MKYKQIIDKLKNDVACKENIINHLAENNIKLQDEQNELLTKLGCPTMATAKRKVFCLQQQLDKLKAENEQLKEELSVIQHNCNREGCKYYDDNTFKVFYECKAQKALQLSANSVTTKYCDLLRTLAEIKEIIKYDVYTTRADLCLRLNWIKKKIRESEVEND